MKNRALTRIVTVTVIFFIFSTVTAGAGLLDQARALFENRQYEKALSLVKKELKKNGENADLLVMMADCYMALGKTSKAERTYRQALALEPGHPDGNLNLGMLLVAERERNEAIMLIQRVLAENPDHARAHFYLGLAYNARADINDAFGQYKILKKLDTKLAAELYNVIFLK